jgi:hypothetical protein
MNAIQKFRSFVSDRTGGVEGVVPLFIAVAVGILVAVNLFPVIYEAIASPSTNTSPLRASDVSMMKLGAMFLALTIGLLPVAVIYKVTQ